MLLYSLITLAACVLLVGADQLSKLYIVRHFELGEVKELIAFGSHKIISITHVRNSGAAWSMLEGKTIFLIAFPVIVIAAAAFFLIKTGVKSKLEYASFVLIVAGGIGNLIDRVRLHEVVDFIKWEVFEFPVFNLADICVVVGAVMLCVFFMFFDKSDESKKNSEKQPATAEDNSDDE